MCWEAMLDSGLSWQLAQRNVLPQPRRNQISSHITLGPTVCYHEVLKETQTVSTVWCHQEKQNETDRQTNKKEPLSVSIRPQGSQLETLLT